MNAQQSVHILFTGRQKAGKKIAAAACAALFTAVSLFAAQDAFSQATRRSAVTTDKQVGSSRVIIVRGNKSATPQSSTTTTTTTTTVKLVPRYQLTKKQLRDQLPVDSRSFGLPQVGTSTKYLLVGFGYVHHRYEARFDGNSNIVGRTADLGLSIGLRNTESLYVSPRVPIMIGFTLGVGSYINFSPSYKVERINSGPVGANIAKFRNAGTVSSFAQTFSAGVTFSTGNSLLISEFTIGPAMNLLVHSLTAEGVTPAKASIALGAGLQGDITWRFRVSPMVSIPINATLGFYPLNLDSFFADVEYRTEFVLIAAAQIGVTFTY